MSASRRYVIIGSGALGGYYGARLHHGGADVGFLLNSDFEHVAANGLVVESVDGDFSIAQPRIYSGAHDIEPADIAVVALKTTHNHLLAELLPAAVRPGGIVLVMQNGLFMEDAAAAAAPAVADPAAPAPPAQRLRECAVLVIRHAGAVELMDTYKLMEGALQVDGHLVISIAEILLRLLQAESGGLRPLPPLGDRGKLRERCDTKMCGPTKTDAHRTLCCPSSR